MSRKYVYPLLFIIATVLIYYANNYLDEKEREPSIHEGKQIKETTNRFLLPSSTTGAVIHHKYYSLSYSEPNEQAEWVAYELENEQLSQNNFDRPYFEIDEAVPTKAAHWRNYKNSGYDRGHLCPAGDRRFEKSAYIETFLTSNISPQKHDFNSGIWNSLEQKVRKWAAAYGSIYVVTGGVLKNISSTIGDEHVAVPNYFYKIILSETDKGYQSLAFLIPHKNTTTSLTEFVTTIDNIEALTGIDFFPNLDDKTENSLEASKSYSNWNLR
tara:strand:- start:1429 stop:2238 length:810 start_codon:yes stop_codon:yes gene_type:complete